MQKNFKLKIVVKTNLLERKETMKKCWLLLPLLLNFCVDDEKILRKKGEKPPLRTATDKSTPVKTVSGWQTAD